MHPGDRFERVEGSATAEANLPLDFEECVDVGAPPIVEEKKVYGYKKKSMPPPRRGKIEIKLAAVPEKPKEENVQQGEVKQDLRVLLRVAEETEEDREFKNLGEVQQGVLVPLNLSKKPIVAGAFDISEFPWELTYALQRFSGGKTEEEDAKNLRVIQEQLYLYCTGNYGVHAEPTEEDLSHDWLTEVLRLRYNSETESYEELQPPPQGTGLPTTCLVSDTNKGEQSAQQEEEESNVTLMLHQKSAWTFLRALSLSRAPSSNIRVLKEKFSSYNGFNPVTEVQNKLGFDLFSQTIPSPNYPKGITFVHSTGSGKTNVCLAAFQAFFKEYDRPVFFVTTKTGVNQVIGNRGEGKDSNFTINARVHFQNTLGNDGKVPEDVMDAKTGKPLLDREGLPTIRYHLPLLDEYRTHSPGGLEVNRWDATDHRLSALLGYPTTQASRVKVLPYSFFSRFLKYDKSQTTQDEINESFAAILLENINQTKYNDALKFWGKGEVTIKNAIFIIDEAHELLKDENEALSKFLTSSASNNCTVVLLTATPGNNQSQIDRLLAHTKRSNEVSSKCLVSFVDLTQNTSDFPKLTTKVEEHKLNELTIGEIGNKNLKTQDEKSKIVIADRSRQLGTYPEFADVLLKSALDYQKKNPRETDKISLNWKNVLQAVPKINAALKNMINHKGKSFLYSEFKENIAATITILRNYSQFNQQWEEINQATIVEIQEQFAKIRASTQESTEFLAIVNKFNLFVSRSDLPSQDLEESVQKMNEQTKKNIGEIVMQFQEEKNITDVDEAKSQIRGTAHFTMIEKQLADSETYLKRKDYMQGIVNLLGAYEGSLSVLRTYLNKTQLQKVIKDLYKRPVNPLREGFKRFYFYDPNTAVANNDFGKVISLFNDFLNRDGDIITAFLSHSDAYASLDLYTVRLMQTLEPQYDYVHFQQLIGRARRYCSHVDLPKKESTVDFITHIGVYQDSEEMRLEYEAIIERYNGLNKEFSSLIKEMKEKFPKEIGDQKVNDPLYDERLHRYTAIQEYERANNVFNEITLQFDSARNSAENVATRSQNQEVITKSVQRVQELRLALVAARTDLDAKSAIYEEANKRFKEAFDEKSKLSTESKARMSQIVVEIDAISRDYSMKYGHSITTGNSTIEVGGKVEKRLILETIDFSMYNQSMNELREIANTNFKLREKSVDFAVLYPTHKLVQVDEKRHDLAVKAAEKYNEIVSEIKRIAPHQ